MISASCRLPVVVQVDAVDRQRLARPWRTASCVGCEQVDEGDARWPWRPRPSRGVELEPLVVPVAVGQVAVVQVLVRDRREEDEPRGRLAVVLLRQRVLDEVVEVVLELVKPASPANDSL